MICETSVNHLFAVTVIQVLCNSNKHPIILRGCTGFDGGFEVAEAIRGLGPRHQLRIKFKRRR